jgi:hypothetical protein
LIFLNPKVCLQLKEWANADDSRTWSPDDVVEWIVTTLPLDRANHILSIEGMQRARELFANYREYTLEDWALLCPGWWETIEEKRQNPNCTLFDFWRTTPPDISGVTIPVSAEEWWNRNIRYKTRHLTDEQKQAKPKLADLLEEQSKEPNPCRRIAYLILAGLLKDISEDGLILFAVSQIEIQTYCKMNKKGRASYVEWDLTKNGWDRLAILNAPPGSVPDLSPTVGNQAASNIEGNKKKRRKPKKGTATGIAAKVRVSTWQGIRLEIDETGKLFVNGQRIGYTLQQLGMGRGASKEKVNQQAQLLIKLAATRKVIIRSNGERKESIQSYIPASDDLYAGKNGLGLFSKHLTRLNAVLRKAFGLKGNPVSLNDKGEVETLFTISLVGEDNIDENEQAHVAKDKAAGRRPRVEYPTLSAADAAEAEEAAVAVAAAKQEIWQKTKDLSRY